MTAAAGSALGARLASPGLLRHSSKALTRRRWAFPLPSLAPMTWKGNGMATCEVCGNDYRLSFEVHAAGAVHVFDSFECAIHRMAPVCEHCGVKIVGHGVEADGVFYCCASCARAPGSPASAVGLADHTGRAPDEM